MAKFISTRRYNVLFTPHAGVGLTSYGASQLEAGATVSVGKRLRSQLGDALGVGSGEQLYGDRGRWYLFGAVKSRAVGLNLRTVGLGVVRDGLTADQGGFSGLVQAGMGWRKAGLQASLGYTRTKVRVRDWGRQRDNDDRLGLTVSLRSR